MDRPEEPWEFKEPSPPHSSQEPILLEHTVSRIAEYLNRFTDEKASPETRRRVALLAGISLIGIVALIPFGILAYLQGNLALAVFDLMTAAVLYLNLLDARKRKKYDFNIHLGIAFAAGLYIYLYLSGGVKNTAFVWYFTFPLIASFLLGSRKGGAATLFMTLPVLLMIFFDLPSPFFAQYAVDFEGRFLMAYLVVGSFSYLFERTQEKNRLELWHLNENLEKKVQERTLELSTSNRQLLTQIKEKREAEKALIRSQETFITVLDGIDAHVYAADIDTYEILFMNRKMQEDFGGDFIGQHCWDVFRKKSGPCQDCMNPKMLNESGKPGELLVREVFNPVMKRWFINYDRAIKWTDDRLAHLQIATDISLVKKLERQRLDAEEQLRQSHKMQAVGTLAGGIAHDFNNILAIILGNAELGLIKTPEKNPLAKNFEQISGACLRARDMVRQLLTFSRKSEPAMAPMDIRLLLKEAMKLLRASIPTSIDIQMEIDDKADFVLGNPTQIDQVLLNLCTNARDAMPEGGTLTVGLKNRMMGKNLASGFQGLSPGKYVQLEVADTGCGIPEKEKARIFEPYYTTKEIGKGTGMGLAVVHGIVEAHQGVLWVESEIGKGTRFTVLFPAAEKPEQVQAARKEKIVQGSETILVVDDEELIAELNRDILTSLGYRAESATDPLEALKRFRSNPDRYRLVLTDMTMPNMTGEKLALEIKKIRPRVPVILCTGYSERISEEKAAEFGIDAFALKPLEIQTLAKTVRQALDQTDAP